MEFALKFKAIADESGYDKILEVKVNVPSSDMIGGEAMFKVRHLIKEVTRT